VEKSPDAFRTISEVADELDVPQHVLRFWESRFREIKPMKRGGGRRYYRPDDVDLVRGIRHLLYGEGYTIRGVQRILKEQGVKSVQMLWQAGAPQLKPHVDDAASAEPDEQRTAAAAPRDRPLVSAPPTRPPEGAARAQRQGATEPPAAVRREPSLPSERLTPPVVTAGSIAPADLRRLKDTLQALTECRAQLDAAIGGVTVAGAPRDKA
jgi:DNA-binding transcriptional MerR regulator